MLVKSAIVGVNTFFKGLKELLMIVNAVGVLLSVVFHLDYQGFKSGDSTNRGVNRLLLCITFVKCTNINLRSGSGLIASGK